MKLYVVTVEEHRCGVPSPVAVCSTRELAQQAIEDRLPEYTSWFDDFKPNWFDIEEFELDKQLEA